MPNKNPDEIFWGEMENRAEQAGNEGNELAVNLYRLCREPHFDMESSEYTAVLHHLKKLNDTRGPSFFAPIPEAVSILAGGKTADIVRYIAEHTAEYPYAVGYYRRPYRTSNLEVRFRTLIFKLNHLFAAEALRFSLRDYLTKPDYKFDRIYWINRVIPDLIAYELDQGDGWAEEALREIVFGENQTALLKPEMIKGILMSHRKELYAMIGELLVAARLQEGLRQAVAEQMDAGTLEANLHLLKVILDQGLIRYSSIVRALGTWTGMGLETANQRVAGQLLEQAYRALTDEKQRDEWLTSPNANQVYLSLWAAAVHEEEDLQERIKHLMVTGERYQKIVAQYVLANSQNDEVKFAIVRECLDETDPELLYWVLRNYAYDYAYEWQVGGIENRILNVNRTPILEDKETRTMEYERFKAILKRVPVKEKSGASGVLDFTGFHYSSDLVLHKMMYLAAYDMDETWIAELIGFSGQMGPDLRGDLINYFTGNPESAMQREFIFSSLTDKSMTNRENALRQVKKLTLNEEELLLVEGLLKLKTGSLRQSAIAILLQQRNGSLASSLERLLKAKGELQRLAGLELLTELKEDRERTEAYESLQPLAGLIASPTPKEKQLLDKLQQQRGYSEEEGFGLFNPQETEAWLLERPDTSSFSLGQLFSLSEERAGAFLRGLDDLVHEHRDTEYDVVYYGGQRDMRLIGVTLSPLTYAPRQEPLDADDFARLGWLEQYPLAETWRRYFEENGLTSSELMELYYCILLKDITKTLYSYYGYFSGAFDYDPLRKTLLLEGRRKEYLEQTIPLEQIMKIQEIMAGLRYREQVETLVAAYFGDSERSETYGLAESALRKTLESDFRRLPEQDRPVLYVAANPWYAIMRSRVHDMESFRAFFRTAYQFDLARKENGNGDYSILHTNHFLRAYRDGLIGENEICKELLGRNVRGYMREITSPQHAMVNGNEKLAMLRERIVSRLLEIELGRGDLKTEASAYTMSFQRIYGMEPFVRILTSLDGETFVRGYIYSYGDPTKKESFSHLLKVCYPREGEDEGKLKQLLAGTGITDKLLLEAAMYAPQWIEIVAKYLGWEGLRSAAWYFHAHINESFSAEKETVVAHYSPITPQEFNDGAFDVKWFEEAHRTLGEERFRLLYDCAKYISGGANHRRSQLFSDAVLGRLRLEDMKRSVEEKRNKDHLLAYSLIPLGCDREGDLRERYDFIQLFLKQSRNFGAQRRASEGTAAQIALGNLARSAGYADVIRLTWDMEARKVETLGSLFEPQPLDSDTYVSLAIDESGKTELEITSKGKKLKSVPAKFKKHGYVEQLKEAKTELTDQYRRAKRELERSMEEESRFRAGELAALADNPVIRPLVETLVFKAGDRLGYFAAGQDGASRLEQPGGEFCKLEESDELTIAHPVDLYAGGQWGVYQRDLFARGIRQPFMQVFRELYLVNEDERKEHAGSRRYAGYQVQPSKTVALLRGRGWTVSYESGLQKVHYRENIIATVYAMADWFSPADSEAPTLETVEFLDRKTYKPVAVDRIPPILFSETMRDIDLVVSTAHVGGVDPEASLTTIELRKVIVEESLRLLKLDNVKLDGNHARIAGKLGEYAVHLGSGIAFKQGKGALNIIPVHSQHRGRLFLPFLDEDPRTAEVLSKVVLLAEDHKIKDPQILMQL
ncbi:MULTISPECIES: DUF4132 domain-containing protein [Paenibacillus]|uniref:DUF4132 domain-containing protein n=1 Tax=Paenibacillus albilobatus TaxID=2716884 RepID=A0A919XFC5_9BACL|nr:MULTISPECIES: DUF4132 domain-containing protein [Paenibacillus]GIO29418.1 hypothetical protein J2TS6_05590 [Paenibacillus albilobatus]